MGWDPAVNLPDGVEVSSTALVFKVRAFLALLTIVKHKKILILIRKSCSLCQLTVFAFNISTYLELCAPHPWESTRCLQLRASQSGNLRSHQRRRLKSLQNRRSPTQPSGVLTKMPYCHTGVYLPLCANEALVQLPCGDAVGRQLYQDSMGDQ